MKFPVNPQAPCAACLEDSNRVAFGADGSMVAIYCPHNQAGGVFRTREIIWTVVGPLSEESFAGYCARLTVLHMQKVAAQDGLPPASKAN